MSIRFVNDELRLTSGLPSTTAFTAAMWCKLSVNRNTYSCPFALDAGAAAYSYIETENDGTFMKAWDETGAAGGINMLQMTVNIWYFCAFSRTNAAINTWMQTAVGGALSTNTGGSSALAPTAMRFGQSPSASEQWNGCIAGAKLWTRVLSTSELDNERRRIMPFSTTSLYAWYPFVSVGSMAVDFSGNGHHLSIISAPTIGDNNPQVPWRVNNSQAPTRTRAT